MSIKLKRIRYRGENWVLFVWAVVCFPVAIVFLILDAVWIEQEIAPEQLEELDRS